VIIGSRKTLQPAGEWRCSINLILTASDVK